MPGTLAGGTQNARGLHRSNYADLPVFDLVFGTFVNPTDFAPATGYYPGGSARVLDMLRFEDVTTPERSTLGERATQRAEPTAILSGSETH